MYSFGGWGDWIDSRTPQERKRDAYLRGRNPEAERAKAKAWRERQMARHRWLPEPLPALPFAVSCVFCRRGYHHPAHFGSCRATPHWARKRGALP